MLLLAKILPIAAIAFFAVVSFIAVKRLDKPNLSQDERNRLKLWVLLLTAFSAVYGHIQGEKIEKELERSAAALPGIQGDLKKLQGQVSSLPTKEWMTFRLRERLAKSANIDTAGEWKLTSGSPREENASLSSEVLSLRAAAGQDPSDKNNIALAHAYIQSRKYTLARQVFELVVQNSNDYLSTEIAGLLAHALRAGLGERLARKEAGLAWVVHWDEEPHYLITVHQSDDRINWVEMTLDPSNPAGTVVPPPMRQYIRISASPAPGYAGKATLYQRTIMLSVGVADRSNRLVHPLLLSKPQQIL